MDTITRIEELERERRELAKRLLDHCDACNFQAIEDIAIGILGARDAILHKIESGIELSKADLEYVKNYLYDNGRQ